MPTELGMSNGHLYDVREDKTTVCECLVEVMRAGRGEDSFVTFHLHSVMGEQWDGRLMLFRASAIVTIAHSEDDD